jgi:glycosyltransferase
LNPPITIITAVYNGSSTIADCLVSVSSQTVPVEHLIIDGASTDTTLDIVRAISPHARIVSEPDRGIYDAMNKGLRPATGEIIGILNSDDVYADDMVLEQVAHAFEDAVVDACYGDLVYVKEMGTGHRAQDERENRSPSTAHQSPFAVVRYWKSGPFAPQSFYWGWMPPHPTFFVRRSVYEKYGLFNLDLGSAADYELMLRFLLKHRINVRYIPEVLVQMRVGGASNVSVAARINANRMDRKAWEINGLKPYPWTFICKPLRKLPQWWQRPNP